MKISCHFIEEIQEFMEFGGDNGLGAVLCWVLKDACPGGQKKQCQVNKAETRKRCETLLASAF